MIELNNIQVTFNPGTILENRALKGVSLEVPEHQFLTVIGSKPSVASYSKNASVFWV